MGWQRGLGAAPQVPLLQKPGDARVPGAGLDGVRAILLQGEARRLPTHAGLANVCNAARVGSNHRRFGRSRVVQDGGRRVCG